MNYQELDEYYDKLHAELGKQYSVEPYMVGKIRSAVSRGETQDTLANILRIKYSYSKKWKNIKATETHLDRLKTVTRMSEETWNAITKPDINDRFLGKNQIPHQRQSSGDGETTASPKNKAELEQVAGSNGMT